MKLARSFCRGLEGDACLARDRRRLVALGCGAIRLDVVHRENARQLTLVERVEITRGGEMSHTPIAATQPCVSNLADETLREPILAALRRPRVGLERDQLLSDEPTQSRCNLICRSPRNSRHRCRRKCCAN